MINKANNLLQYQKYLLGAQRALQAKTNAIPNQIKPNRTEPNRTEPNRTKHTIK